MNKLQLAIKAYKDADHSLNGHLGSDFLQLTKNVEVKDRYQAYLDLDHWPESELLTNLSDQEKQELRTWGSKLERELNDFYQKSQVLVSNRLKALLNALFFLGAQAAQEVLAATGPLTERVTQALRKADSIRRKDLDGIGYVDVVYDDASFAKGFYKTLGMKRDKFFADMKLCTQYMEKCIELSEEEKKRLGFAVEVADESR